VGQIGFHPVRIALLPELPDRGGLPDDVPPWEIFDVVVEYPGEGFWGVSTSNSAQTSVWDPKPAHAFDAQGRIYVHHGAPYSIWVYDASGSLLRRVSRDTAPVPVTEAVRERYRASAHEYYGGRGGVPAFVQETLELTERRLGEILQFSDPDQVPKLGAMVVTDDGAIWVERPDLVEDPFLLFWNPDNLAQPRYWDVFDPDGRFLGTVRIERPTTIHAVGTDWILVTERDELDVQYIVRYGVGPGA
jgi:hypothetical protein